MTAYAVMAIPVLVATTVIAGICMRNFGKGLEVLVRRKRVPDADERDGSSRGGLEAGSGGVCGDLQQRMMLE